MNSTTGERIAITGIGLVTPLGNSAEQVLERILAGDCAASLTGAWESGTFDCPVSARVKEFDARPFVSEPKMVRLMNRDAQLAVAAARLALQDAGVKSGVTYSPEEIALFGATGLAGLPLREITPLIRVSAGPNGEFDLARFGQTGIKAVSPILSFKILSNMPLCFVSINENIQGPNAIYTPWEGEGAQAIEAGIRALQAGDARCALVGGCDVKTHELAFASLQQHGLFDSWSRTGKGRVPAEGAAFLVLETEDAALSRKAHRYGYLGPFKLAPHCRGKSIVETRAQVLKSLGLAETEALLGAANDDEGQEAQEAAVHKAAGVALRKGISPKQHVGDLFAAAAPLQVALAAALTGTGTATVIAECFGHGSTQAAFVLEQA